MRKDRRGSGRTRSGYTYLRRPRRHLPLRGLSGGDRVEGDRRPGLPRTAAYGGIEALELSLRQPSHVILLDPDLPEVDGHGVARCIREREPRPPYLVAISGFGGDCHLRRYCEAGIDRHSVKPVNIDQVPELLRSISAQHPSS